MNLGLDGIRATLSLTGSRGEYETRGIILEGVLNANGSFYYLTGDENDPVRSIANVTYLDGVVITLPELHKSITSNENGGIIVNELSDDNITLSSSMVIDSKKPEGRENDPSVLPEPATFAVKHNKVTVLFRAGDQIIANAQAIREKNESDITRPGFQWR